MLLPAVEQQRFTRLDDLRRQALSVLHRGLGPTLAALVVVGELDPPGGLVVQRDVRDVGVEGLRAPARRRARSARRGSSCDESAWPTLFTVASSPTRWRVSCTSRAFSSATVTLPASVVRSRWSSSPKACSRSMFCSEITPAVLPPATSGTKSTDFGRSPATIAAAVSLGLGIEVLGDQQRLARLQHVLREAGQRSRLGPQPLPSFDQVRVLDEAGTPRRPWRSRRPARRRRPGSGRRPRRRSPARRARLRSLPARC